jgi:drug/metabolite transporter (DMT)-like permease
LIVGLAASVGHLLLAMALKKTHASIVTPFLYAQLPFTVIAGWLLFSRVPDAWSFAGMGLIALCGLANAWLSLRGASRLSATAASATASAV